MVEDWKQNQQQIAEDLRQDGIEFTFLRQIDSEYDPIAGQYLNNQEQSFTAYGIFTSSGINPPTSFIWQTDTIIEQGDKVLMLECSTYTAMLGDKVIIDSVEWLVKACGFLEPGGIPLLQYILIRRA